MNQFDKGYLRKTVRLASELLDKTKICTKITELRDEERKQKKKRPGGRPAYLDDRAVLVIIMTLVLLDLPLLFTRATDLLECFGPKEFRELGIPHDKATRAALYHRIHRAWNRCVSVIDPLPYPKRRLLTKEEWAEIEAKRNAAISKEKLTELRRVCNHLLEATHRWALDKDPGIFASFDNNYCTDATLVATFGKRGTPKRSRYVSREPDASWYTRDGDHRDDGQGKHKKLVWGYEAHLVVLAGDSLEDGFPRIVIAIDFDKPGYDVSGHGRRTVESNHERRHEPGFLVADRAYLPNSKPENLQIPLRKMGYELCFDYQTNQLGITANHKGAIQVEGTWFCPAMPQELIDATKNFRAGTIDEETYRARIESRRAYRFRRAAKPQADGSVPMMCPAAGISATVVCPLKKSVRKKTAGLPHISNPPTHPDEVCINRKTTTFEGDAGAKFAQALLYESPEWKKRYASARNTIESTNAYLKDANHGALHDGGRRRAAGFATQFLFTTLIVLAANVRKIETFLENKASAVVTRLPKLRRRDRLDKYQGYEEIPPEA